MRKRTLIAAALVLTNIGAVAAELTDEAEVIAATPIYETVNQPERDCWTESATPQQPYEPRSRSYVGATVGAVTGGVIGNQMGAGNGKTAATAAGAVIGAYAGDRVDNGPDQRSYWGPIIGGVAGGLLGAQIGAGTGRDVAAAIGAVTGAVVGDRLANGSRQSRSASAPTYAGSATVQRCRTVDNYRQVVSGYTVLYRYNGREAETVMRYRPGPTIKVAIVPAEGAR